MRCTYLYLSWNQLRQINRGRHQRALSEFLENYVDVAIMFSGLGLNRSIYSSRRAEISMKRLPYIPDY